MCPEKFQGIITDGRQSGKGEKRTTKFPQLSPVGAAVNGGGDRGRGGHRRCHNHSLLFLLLLEASMSVSFIFDFFFFCCQKMGALKRAYADIILNTAKESAARVLAAERRALRCQQAVFAAKEEALTTILRLKAIADSKVIEFVLN